MLPALEIRRHHLRGQLLNGRSPFDETLRVKETGDKQLFGVLGRGKTQVAYAKVTLNIVNIRTSEVVRSVQGAGEFQLSNREIVGFGGTASYDSTLNGKVLDLAVREAVDRLGEAVDAGALPSISANANQR